MEAAIDVLRWGGVTGRNERTLRRLGGDALPEFLADGRLLDPARADTSKLDGVRRMNSGWTKIQALLLDDFPMYDGRVGARWAAWRGCTPPTPDSMPSRNRCASGGIPGRAPTTATRPPARSGFRC